MRVLLVSLNARFVHTSLALRYLREAIKPEFPEVLLKEFTINERVESIAAEIYEAQAEVIGFSCYIWNIEETLKVIRYLHPVCPEVRFVLGGPEVSFEAEELLSNNPEVDAIVVGEGEIPFPQLLKAWSQGAEPIEVPGLVWRRVSESDAKSGGLTQGITVNPPVYCGKTILDVPMPYGTEEDFNGRIVYVETTRGCPFNCQYCLSSTFTGMRYLRPERFRTMFKALLSMGARTIKFVDRTFNARKDHAFKILNIVRDEAQAYENVRVHCEMAGDLLDADWLEYLAGYPSGLIQLEIGVQSTHPPTLKAISRVQHFEDWKDKVTCLQQEYGIPIHLDLIAGLPGESFSRFGQSFDDVYAASPNRLQLGFLKVLKGSGMRLRSADYGLEYSPDPPYTILQTKDITHAELLQLTRIEELLESFYNSGRFKTSLNTILSHYASPFAFYAKLASFWQTQNWFKQSAHGKNLFPRLWQFILFWQQTEVSAGDPVHQVDLARLRDALCFDYYLWERPVYLPDFLNPLPEFTNKQLSSWQEEIRKDPVWQELITESAKMDRRQWSRATAVGYFTHQITPDPSIRIHQVRLSSPQTEERPTGYWYLFYYRRPSEVFLIE